MYYSVFSFCRDNDTAGAATVEGRENDYIVVKLSNQYDQRFVLTLIFGWIQSMFKRQQNILDE